MLTILASSDLAAIRDLAIARAALVPASSAVVAAARGAQGVGAWEARTARLVDRITGLPANARTELLALVWLGRGHAGDWEAVLGDARTQDDRSTPRYLASMPLLDAFIDRGLLAMNAAEG